MLKVKKNKQYFKIPVLFKSGNKLIPLLPTKFYRAFRLIRSGKAVLLKDRIIGNYLLLKYIPNNTNVKNHLILGIDPGTLWTGYSLLNNNTNINYEEEYSKLVYNRNYIKDKTKSRKENRILRRSILKNRKYRNRFRTSTKVTNTSNFYYQARRNMIERLTKFYPIDTVVIEDVKFNHFEKSNGSSFSNVEVGKNKLYNKIKSLNLTLILKRGFETADLRNNLNLPKLKNKSSKSIYAHCVDSYCLARLSNKYMYYPDITKYMYFISNSEKNVNILSKKRHLVDFKCKYKNKKYYNRKTKKYSKLKKIRIKTIDTNSKHLTVWEYMYTERVECYHKFVKNYNRFKSVFSRYGTSIYNELQHFKSQ